MADHPHRNEKKRTGATGNEDLLIRGLARNIQLLDFIRVTGRRCGIDGDLEQFPAGIEQADHVFFIGFRRLVGDRERTRGIGFEKIAKDFAGLFLGTASGRRDDSNVQIVGEPGGEGGGISGGEVLGNGGEYRKTVFLGLWQALGIAHIERLSPRRDAAA